VVGVFAVYPDAPAGHWLQRCGAHQVIHEAERRHGAPTAAVPQGRSRSRPSLHGVGGGFGLAMPAILAPGRAYAETRFVTRDRGGRDGPYPSWQRWPLCAFSSSGGSHGARSFPRSCQPRLTLTGPWGVRSPAPKAGAAEDDLATARVFMRAEQQCRWGRAVLRGFGPGADRRRSRSSSRARAPRPWPTRIHPGTRVLVPLPHALDQDQRPMRPPEAPVVRTLLRRRIHAGAAGRRVTAACGPATPRGITIAMSAAARSAALFDAPNGWLILVLQTNRASMTRKACPPRRTC